MVSSKPATPRRAPWRGHRGELAVPTDQKSVITNLKFGRGVAGTQRTRRRRALGVLLATPFLFERSIKPLGWLQRVTTPR